VKLGRTEEAEDTYRALLEQNSENLEYYRGFLRTKGLNMGGLTQVEFRIHADLVIKRLKPGCGDDGEDLEDSTSFFGKLSSVNGAPSFGARRLAG